MLRRLVQSALFVGIVGGLAIAPSSKVNAQIAVTGGTISFKGSQIYVPDINSNLGAVIYNGTAGVLVRTSAIPSINNTVLLRGGILPTLNTCPCSAPQVSDTGTWLTTLTFVGRSSAGEPTLFANIPAELNFTVTGLAPTGIETAIDRFESFPVLLTETGVAVNASSFGGVQRTTPVVFVEFGDIPSSSLVNFGIASVTPGVNYPADIAATITSGTISAPLANSFGGVNSSPPGSSASNNGSNGSFTVVSSTSVGAFNSVTSIYSVYGPSRSKPDSSNQNDDAKIGESDSNSDDKNEFKDDRETIFVDRNTKTRYVVVGLPSRVFPGVIGVETVKIK
ncbi:hypothetical protein AB3R30_18310 [Leptolyngbyaceae cyanobacterium UHCC 1019]